MYGKHACDCCQHFFEALKSCRWIGVQTVVFILLHGIFYHILWATGGAEKYREEAFRFAYHHWFSNGGGLVAWFGALIIGITAIPWFRRHMYWVRLETKVG